MSAHVARPVVIISGDREWGGKATADSVGLTRQAQRENDVVHGTILAAREELGHTVLFVLGDARGTDSIALTCCRKHRISHAMEYAYWEMFHGGAGPERNGRMKWHAIKHAVPARCYAFHDALDMSKGTRNCVTQILEHAIADVVNFRSDGSAYDVFHDGWIGSGDHMRMRFRYEDH
jgi:hypothetical protein